MDAAPSRELVERLRAMLPPGCAVADGCRVVEVREAGDEAVVLVRWDRDPGLYGVPVPLTDTRHEFFYPDYEVASTEEWLDSVGEGLRVMLDTGHRATARRRRVADYIELRDTGGWPGDERFSLQDGLHDADLLAERLRRDGLDPTLALERQAQGRLMTWLLSYENNATGGPWVGHAVVSHQGEATALLEQVETLPGAPPSVALDLAYFASHAAVAQGAMSVTTALCDPELALAGFRADASGTRVLSADFLDADPDGARVVLERGRASGGRWGADRDEAGRHLPATRVGRLVHRLRWGRSGRRPRMWAG
jgi:hypothetical protein